MTPFIKATETGEIAMTKYHCDDCGACCRGYLLVEADLLDLLREPRLLKADPHRSGWSFDAAARDLEEEGRCLLVSGDTRCPFLGAESRCSIYPTRPNACVGMQAGDEQCQEVRSEVGLPPLESLAPSRA